MVEKADEFAKDLAMINLLTLEGWIKWCKGEELTPEDYINHTTNPFPNIHTTGQTMAQDID
jgi:hypothetical protein